VLTFTSTFGVATASVPQAFERIDELVAFVLTDSCQGEIKPDRVE
jgi:hypothetical protein